MLLIHAIRHYISIVDYTPISYFLSIFYFLSHAAHTPMPPDFSFIRFLSFHCTAFELIHYFREIFHFDIWFHWHFASMPLRWLIFISISLSLSVDFFISSFQPFSSRFHWWAPSSFSPLRYAGLFRISPFHFAAFIDFYIAADTAITLSQVATAMRA